MKNYLRDVLILAILAILVVMCSSAAYAGEAPDVQEQDMLDLLWWLRNGGCKVPMLDEFCAGIAMALFDWCPIIDWRTWTGPYWP